MTEKSNFENFEKYMTRKPLSEELRKVRDGESDGLESILEVAAGWTPRATSPMEDPDRELNKAERLTLREAQQVGAVTTLIRLLRRSLRLKTRAATVNSENDPLGRQAEIAQDWAYVMAFRRVATEIEALILAEIATLEAEEAGDKHEGLLERHAAERATR